MLSIILAAAAVDLSAPVKWLKRVDIAYSADYPRDAVRSRTQGRISVKLTVDDTGKPVRCELVQKSDSAPLNVRTCSILMLRTNFEPARDLNGSPVQGQLFTSILWGLPGIKSSSPFRRASPDIALSVKSLPHGRTYAWLSVRVLIDQDGAPVHCALNQTSDEPVLDRSACPAIVATNKFGPVADGRGQAAPTMLTLNLAFIVPGAEAEAVANRPK